MSNNKKEKNILRRGALVCAVLLILTSLVLIIFGDLNSTGAAVRQLKEDVSPFNRLQLPDELGGTMVITLIDSGSEDLWMVATEESAPGEYSYVYVLNLDDGITMAYRYMGDEENLESATYLTPVRYRFSPFTFRGRFTVGNKGTTAAWVNDNTQAHVEALGALAEDALGAHVNHGGAVVLLVLMAIELIALISFIGASKMNKMF